MKKKLIVVLTMIPMLMAAQQTTWNETPQNNKTDNTVDTRYLAGAVPMVDDHVLFETTINIPNKTKAQLYDDMLSLMQGLTTDENQIEQQSHVTLQDKDKGVLAGSYHEWMVFKNTALVLDRTRFCYHLIADCSDGQVTLKLTRIIYIYDEERQPQTYRAEEWINDRYGLTKKQDKLARVSGKFRRKTIDRKDFLFEKFERLLKSEK